MKWTGALPVRSLEVCGMLHDALIDTGCTRSIVHCSVCRPWERHPVNVITASGHNLRCAGVADISVQVPGLNAVTVSALVTEEKPLGFLMVLGMDGVQALGGVSVRSPTEVLFCGERDVCAGLREKTDSGTSPDMMRQLSVDKEDFRAWFDKRQRCWVVSWKWSEDKAPDVLRNSVAQYRVSHDVKAAYEEEVALWIRNGWLQPYDEQELGPPKGLIPMMAVVQQNKQKVRPVLDFREMNGHVDTHTAEVDVCIEKLREWRKMGQDVALLDLKKAYLQIRVEKKLWPYQTVIVGGVRYCLTRLGFGLNLAPCVMKAVLDTVISQDPDVKRAVSTYIDDLRVDETVLSAEKVTEHLKRFGLECKQAVRLKDGGRALGLRVTAGRGSLSWRRDNDIGGVEAPLTKRKIFALCGSLTGHLPVCGWLRPATSYLKRRASQLEVDWDDPIGDTGLQEMIEELLNKVAADDPAKGRWNVAGSDVTVWTDASSLALGVAIELDGEVMEDGCWLRKDDGIHKNVAELDAAIKGVNLAISWGAKKLCLMTDSRTVYHWISNALSGKMRLKTKAASEMLIRRRLSTLQMLTEEYELDLSVRCVASAANRSDTLTRVPQKWLAVKSVAADSPSDAPETRNPVAAPEANEPRAACAVTGEEGRNCPAHVTKTSEQTVQKHVAQIHAAAGHPGVRKTHFFAKREMPQVTRSCARDVVTSCQVCQSIDPAPVKWKKGELSVLNIWERLGMDITEYQGRSFLTIIDCGPSRFTIWRQLRLKTSAAVIAELRSIFFERGAPEEILLDNDPVFRSRRFESFSAEWGVRLRFRCAYVPSGNGVIERVHRTVKTIAARKGCDILEAVYLYNSSPKDTATDASVPANQLYRYSRRTQLFPADSEEQQKSTDGHHQRKGGYDPGDAVWVRLAAGRCHTRCEKGVVTRQISEQAVEVDGVPRHIRELRPRIQEKQNNEGDKELEQDSPLLVSLPLPAQSREPWPPQAAAEVAPPVLRRSERLRSRDARETQV